MRRGAATQAASSKRPFWPTTGHILAAYQLSPKLQVIDENGYGLGQVMAGAIFLAMVAGEEP